MADENRFNALFQNLNNLNLEELDELERLSKELNYDFGIQDSHVIASRREELKSASVTGTGSENTDTQEGTSQDLHTTWVDGLDEDKLNALKSENQEQEHQKILSTLTVAALEQVINDKDLPNETHQLAIDEFNKRFEYATQNNESMDPETTIRMVQIKQYIENTENDNNENNSTENDEPSLSPEEIARKERKEEFLAALQAYQASDYEDMSLHDKAMELVQVMSPEEITELKEDLKEDIDSLTYLEGLTGDITVETITGINPDKWVNSYNWTDTETLSNEEFEEKLKTASSTSLLSALNEVSDKERQALIADEISKRVSFASANPDLISDAEFNTLANCLDKAEEELKLDTILSQRDRDDFEQRIQEIHQNRENDNNSDNGTGDNTDDNDNTDNGTGDNTDDNDNTDNGTGDNTDDNDNTGNGSDDNTGDKANDNVDNNTGDNTSDIDPAKWTVYLTDTEVNNLDAQELKEKLTTADMFSLYMITKYDINSRITDPEKIQAIMDEVNKRIKFIAQHPDVITKLNYEHLEKCISSAKAEGLEITASEDELQILDNKFRELGLLSDINTADSHTNNSTNDNTGDNDNTGNDDAAGDANPDQQSDENAVENTSDTNPLLWNVSYNDANLATRSNDEFAEKIKTATPVSLLYIMRQVSEPEKQQIIIDELSKRISYTVANPDLVTDKQCQDLNDCLEYAKETFNLELNIPEEDKNKFAERIESINSNDKEYEEKDRKSTRLNSSHAT